MTSLTGSKLLYFMKLVLKHKEGVQKVGGNNTNGRKEINYITNDEMKLLGPTPGRLHRNY